MDPDNIAFASAAIEVCDETPSFVESHIDYFVDVVKAYCRAVCTDNLHFLARVVGKPTDIPGRP
jgi:hypothetical protein